MSKVTAVARDNYGAQILFHLLPTAVIAGDKWNTAFDSCRSWHMLLLTVDSCEIFDRCLVTFFTAKFESGGKSVLALLDYLIFMSYQKERHKDIIFWQLISL